jgi:hypothetical protein
MNQGNPIQTAFYDIVLIKTPSHNMDYPHLALPTLAAVLENAGFAAIQMDLNLELRDHLLTSPMLRAITYSVIPEMAKSCIANVREFEGIKTILEYLLFTEEHIGFGQIELAKTMMQDRRYVEVFEDADLTRATLLMFLLCGMLHKFIDMSIAFEECGGCLRDGNPVCDYLEAKVAAVAGMNPRAVGFSVLQIQRRATCFFARRLRPEYSGKVLIGGADVSTFETKYLDHYPFFDVAFLKEAEVSLVEYLRGERLDRIAGIAFRTPGGQTVMNPPAFDKQQSCFKPKFDSRSLEKYLLPTLPISTSRGCAYARCTFCNHFKTYSGYYHNDVTSTVDNLQYLKEAYRTKFFHFVDDMLSVETGTAISEEIVRRNLEVSILTYARLEKGFTRRILEKWKAAGIDVIEWGLESASDNVLRLAKKGITAGQAQRILDESSEAGIINKLMLFHNYPGESLECFSLTLDFLKRNIKNRRVRPFFTIRSKLELRLDSPLEVLSRTPERSPFRKRYERASELDSLFGYEDGPEYSLKVRCMEEFMAEMAEYIFQNSIFNTTDENVTLDLILRDLIAKGRSPLIHIQ